MKKENIWHLNLKENIKTYYINIVEYRTKLKILLEKTVTVNQFTKIKTWNLKQPPAKTQLMTVDERHNSWWWITSKKTYCTTNTIVLIDSFLKRGTNYYPETL